MDGEAARAGVTGDQALDALIFDWDAAYEIGGDARGYRARRRDGAGELAADDVDELRALIRDDYVRRPVPREFAPAGEP